jgi:hypothetical protein
MVGIDTNTSSQKRRPQQSKPCDHRLAIALATPNITHRFPLNSWLQPHLSLHHQWKTPRSALSDVIIWIRCWLCVLARKSARFCGGGSVRLMSPRRLSLWVNSVLYDGKGLTRSCFFRGVRRSGGEIIEMLVWGLHVCKPPQQNNTWCSKQDD